jgi:hypothetical protein
MGRFFSKLGVGFSTMVELIRAMSRGRYWWLVPVVLFLLPVALLFVLLQTVPYVAPFVYTVF